MSPTLNTVFVLGAGFSVGQGYPLARTMRERLIEFLKFERHSEYQGFLEPGSGGYREGQFYAGLNLVEQSEGELEFEELLMKLAVWMKKGYEDPCCQTDEVLRIGIRRLLWSIHDSIGETALAYKNFATWLGMKRKSGIISLNWDLQAELLLTQANLSWSYSAGSGVPIIKPHGSINWRTHVRKGLSAEYPHWELLGPDSKLSYDSIKPLSNPDPDGINRNLNYFLLPGDPDHPETDKDVKWLWSEANRLISMAEIIVFIGYSLPDYDSYAQMFFKRTVKGKRVIAINPSKCDLKKFTSVMGTDVKLRQEKFSDCQFGQPAVLHN